MNTKASLIVVGSGIKFMSHLTIEARANIEQADKVLYLVNEPAIKEWIKNTNPNSESLDDLYTKYNLRVDCYKEITDYILKNLYETKHVCVVLYGHPTIFAKPALDAVVIAKKNGFYAKILPGISAEACLYADLLIDPGSNGCMSLDATDLLVNKRRIDTSLHIILWQISIIGMLGHNKYYNNQKGITLLRNYLYEYYNPTQDVILYTAAQYPGFEPNINKTCLSNIPGLEISRISTLYIPPIHHPISDKTMLEAFGI